MKKLFIALISILNLSYLQTAKAQTPTNPASFSPNDHSTMVSFKTLDGTLANAFYIPCDSVTGNVLIIFHEQWGLTNEVIKEAQKWKAELGNVDVYAIDMFGGKVTSDPGVSMKYLQALDEARSGNIIRGLLSHIGIDKRIITMGWGEGAHWAFRAAMIAGDQAIGCVMYYGKPEKEDKDVRGLHFDVLYNWASRDKYIQKQFVDDFGHRIELQKRKFEMHTYNADPMFADPSNPRHDAVLTAEADKYSKNFMKLKFQIE